VTERSAAGGQDPDEFGVGGLFWLTSEAIVAADLESERVVLWNPAAERLFGYPSTEALGMRLDRLVPDELRDRHLAGIRRYRGGGAATLVGGGPIAVPAVNRVGDRLDVALTLTDVSHGRPAQRFVLAVIRDVTAQARAERELEATNQAMREFVATASHDLRTPLTAVLGFGRFLEEHGETLGADQRREHLGAILRSAELASRLVDDLLTLSQIQAGAVAIRPERVQLALAAREARAETGSSATITVDDDLAVQVDPTHLERMLVNYLTNADRYGTPPVQIVATRQGGTVTVRVCDAGPGVPDGFAPRLFTSFARANPGAGKGTGLGLSIVKGLAAANGGDVFYETSEDLGSCFGLTLPAATS